MDTPFPRVPVSEETINILLKMLRQRKMIPGMLGVEKSQNPSELIFNTAEGIVLCPVKEDDMFVFLELPSSGPLCPCFAK
jgi:hypothetical protein